MSRQLEQTIENQGARRLALASAAINGDLARAVQRAGGELVGFSVKLSEVECLLVLRADFPAGRMVAFCASSDLPAALVKAVYEGSRDKLRWRADRYVGES